MEATTDTTNGPTEDEGTCIRTIVKYITYQYHSSHCFLYSVRGTPNGRHVSGCTRVHRRLLQTRGRRDRTVGINTAIVVIVVVGVSPAVGCKNPPPASVSKVVGRDRWRPSSRRRRLPSRPSWHQPSRRVQDSPTSVSLKVVGRDRWRQG